MSDDKAYVSCMLASEPPTASIPVEIVACEICKAECWIGMSLYPRVLAGELIPICLPCTPGVIGMISGPEFRLHESQVEELRALGLLEHAQNTVDRLNRARREVDGK